MCRFGVEVVTDARCAAVEIRFVVASQKLASFTHGRRMKLVIIFFILKSNVSPLQFGPEDREEEFSLEGYTSICLKRSHVVVGRCEPGFSLFSLLLWACRFVR